ncbi:hypothetical protein [Sphingobacterium thalpophilum]|uniref:hypothetical protein n=1 Tax=Sphingobacterium thalpophilum TaxID=259 RepID=UPI0024A6A832|nr:hypothetical protein [Sphingobacterium thalpophilum]
MAKAIIIAKVEHKDLGPACKVNTYRWGDGALSGDDITIGAEKVGLKKPIKTYK